MASRLFNSLRRSRFSSSFGQQGRRNGYYRFSTEETSTNESTADAKANKRAIIAEVKKSPRMMRVWAALGLFGVVGSTMYYLQDDESYEKKLDKALRLIRNPDPQAEKRGLKVLDSCLYLEKRLFSNTAEIPQPKTVLIENGCVEALLDLLKTKDDSVRHDALVWLIRLADVPEGRKKFIDTEGLDKVFDLVRNMDAVSPLWILSSSLLLKLCKNDDSLNLIPGASLQQIPRLFTHEHPLSSLMWAEFMRTLINSGNERAQMALSSEGIDSARLSALSTPASLSAIESAINRSIPREPGSGKSLLGEETLYHLLWAGGYGVVGSAYGKTRWLLRSYGAGLRGKDLWKFISKQKPGRWIFLLLGMDLFAQALMNWPQQGIDFPLLDANVKIPNEIAGLHRTTTIPILEAGAFASLGLIALRYQRYVALPLILACLQTHFRDVDYYSRKFSGKSFQNLVGIDEKSLLGRLTEVTHEEDQD